MEAYSINVLFNSKYLNNWCLEMLLCIHTASQFLLRWGGRKTIGTFFQMLHAHCRINDDYSALKCQGLTQCTFNHVEFYLYACV